MWCDAVWYGRVAWCEVAVGVVVDFGQQRASNIKPLDERVCQAETVANRLVLCARFEHLCARRWRLAVEIPIRKPASMHTRASREPW